MYLKPMGVGFFPDADKAKSPQEAAEYLWMRFTRDLEY